MPNFNFLTVEETRQAAKELADKRAQEVSKKISSEPKVRNNAKKGTRKAA